MSARSEKRFIARAHEAAALARGETVEIRRAMKPQPVSEGYVLAYNSDGYRMDAAGTGGVWMLELIKSGAPIVGDGKWQKIVRAEIVRMFCPWPTGSRWWVAEAWRTNAAHDDKVPADIEPSSQQLVAYEEAIIEPRALYPFGKVRSPAQMPRWASRTDAVVLAVRIERGEVWEWVVTMDGTKR